MDHTVVSVLSTTVICVEVGVLLTHAVVVEIIVQLTYNSVGTLAAIPSFICEEVDLPRYCFTIDAKHCALTWSKKVNRAWLPRIPRVMNLLGVIKGVLYLHVL